MGLDIRAYSRLVPDPQANPEEYEDDTAQFFHNPDFPKHAEGLTPGLVYRYAQTFGFRAGSYSSYGAWRNELAQLAGYGQDQLFEGEIPEGNFFAHAAWDSQGGPFHELINFSDCEGTIGPVVAAKLQHDFDMFDELAKNHVDGFYEKYCDWKRAFELAVDGGAVAFG